MNQQTLSQHSYFISAIAHLLILFAGGIYFSSEMASIQVGVENEVLVKSYISTTERATNHLTKQVVAAKAQNNKKKQAKNAVNLTQAMSESQSSETTASSRGVAVDELAALLHDAIQAKQQYPASAMEMEREGRVRVGFILQPNGMAQQIELIHSSGTSSLDAAGLQAVRDATPFKQVDRYLTNAREFQIDVVFALR